MKDSGIKHKNFFERPLKLDDMIMPPVEQLEIDKTVKQITITDSVDSDHAQLAGLVDFSQMNEIFESFLDAIGIPAAIIDLEGKVLAGSR